MPQKNKKMVILLTVCVTVIVTISLFATVSLFIRNVSTLSVNESIISVKSLGTSNEERVLIAAVYIDYTAIAALERFYSQSDPAAYIHSGTYAYTWANFIDSEVIDYYQNRHDYQQKQKESKNVTFTYDANVTHLEQLHVFNSPGGNMTYQNEVIPWHNNTVVFYDIDTTFLTTADFMTHYAHAFYRNQSEYHQLQPEFDLNFSNCYLVEMELKYGEYYAPLASFFVNIHQIVVFDQNLVPVWVGIRSTQGIS
ncbi:MAG: hypothetical protein LBC12_07375 [Nitrososphaerota archaeon]|jgi:hypothetical protein|nr:hypothetical protein [Nitrososphaerota archaeon]